MSRKKPVAVATPAVVGEGRVEPFAVVVTTRGFPAWLDQFQATRPFTIPDCVTLKEMLKKDMPTFLIDVVFDDTHVHVYAYASRDCMTATYTRDLVLT